MDTNKAAQSFELEIKKELKKRGKFVFWDSTLAHCVLWLSIIASFASSVMVASGQQFFSNHIWLAIIAGIPGLVVLVEKTFDFSKRSATGILYKIELQELKNDYDFGKINAYRAAQRLQEIIRRHESSVLKVGMSVGDRNGYTSQHYFTDHAPYREDRKDPAETNTPAEKSHSGNGALSNGNGVR
ncbi:MAG: hypothetical protein KIT80_07065 [Chitinophagaceae bacterium]|nr:hypothetical protein [Chitinophagaceae bacterium]MCW5926659.1 hypothetical protein [Chitinophagaceae bacterium]